MAIEAAGLTAVGQFVVQDKAQRVIVTMKAKGKTVKLWLEDLDAHFTDATIRAKIREQIADKIADQILAIFKQTRWLHFDNKNDNVRVM